MGRDRDTLNLDEAKRFCPWVGGPDRASVPPFSSEEIMTKLERWEIESEYGDDLYSLVVEFVDTLEELTTTAVLEFGVSTGAAREAIYGLVRRNLDQEMGNDE